MKELIRRLTETYGPSGHEEQIRQVIQRHLDGLVDDMRTDTLGNLIARRGARSSEPGLKVMLAAHMDEIGIVVTHIDEKGFLRFAPVGGVTPLTLLGSRALFADGTVGVFGRETRDADGDRPKIERMFLDVGAADRGGVPVNVGDVACFLRPMADLGPRLVAKALDDRIGCAVLIQTLHELDDTPHELYVVFTVQEEVGLRGAVTSTYGVAPDLAIAVDITGTGDTPEARTMAVALGKGPAIKVKDRAMLAHPRVKTLLMEAARRAGISYQMEVLERGTTDAAAMQITREGVPAGAISIATRYAHTPSEMVDYGDVMGTVRLLTALLGNPIGAEQLGF